MLYGEEMGQEVIKAHVTVLADDGFLDVLDFEFETVGSLMIYVKYWSNASHVEKVVIEYDQD